MRTDALVPRRARAAPHQEPEQEPGAGRDGEAAPGPGSETSRDLAESASIAITSMRSLPARLSAFSHARDQLDLAGTRAHARVILDHLTQVAVIRNQVRAAVDEGPGNTVEQAADHGRLLPLAGTLDALLTVWHEQAAAEIGPHRFAGRAVMPGAEVHAPRALSRAIEQLGHEASEVAVVVALAAEIRDSWIASSGLPTESLQHLIGRELAVQTSSRPVRFAFVKAALSSLGIWEHVARYQAPKAQRDDKQSLAAAAANAMAPERTVSDLDTSVSQQARQFGAAVDLKGFDQATAIDLLEANTSFTYLDDQHTMVARSSLNAPRVLTMIIDHKLDSAALGAVLEHFRRANVLDLFAGGLPWAVVKTLDLSLPRGFEAVSRELAPHYMHRSTKDNSLGGLLEDVPVVGGALESAMNFATVGFLREHDASYRLERQGQITEKDHAANTGAASGRAGVILAASAVGGTIGGALGKGVAGAILGRAAGTTGGRIATATAVGVGGGALGNVGARAGSDLVDGELSGLDTYGHDALVGAAVGGAVGGTVGTVAAGAGAIAGRSPAFAATLSRLARRFPTIPPDGPLLTALADLSERAGASAGRAVVRVVLSPLALADAIAAGAVRASPAARAALARIVAQGDDLAARGLDAMGIDPGDLGGPPPAPAGGYGTNPPAPGSGPRTASAIEVELTPTAAGDTAAATVTEARQLGDSADDALTTHLGSGPEAEGMQTVKVAADAKRQRQATAAATRSNIGSRTPLAEHIPPPGPEFIEWWDSLTLKELDALLADRNRGALIGARKIIGANVRHPGGMHEWLKVSHQLQIKRWGVSLQTVLDARTRTEATIGRHFRHDGSTGSRMHRQLDTMIETSPSFDAFKTRLNEWADLELFPVRGPNGEPPAGRYYLPPELQTR